MKKTILSIITAMIVFSTLFFGGVSVSAESIEELQKQIKQHENEKSRILEEKSNLDTDWEDTENKINENLKEQQSVEEEIAEIENELVKTHQDIEAKEEEIEETNKEIDELNERIELLVEEIEMLEDRIAKREKLLKERLRAIQQNGGQIKWLEVIFDSKSFIDFISRASAVNTIMDQDKQIMEEQAADKQLLAENKAEVEENKNQVVQKKEELEGQKKELLALKAQLDEQRDEREALMAQLEEEQQELEEIKLTLEEEQAILEAEEKAKAKAIALAKEKINELEQLAREEEERRKKELAAKEKNSQVAAAPQTSISSGGNGMFMDPVNGRLTSRFGTRTHPIFGDRRFHAGVDFAVGTGTPLSAPADGVVSTAGWRGGFGNVIMISHYIDGQHYTTVMAHLSRIDVSEGQEVSRGQVIGATGNTGNSTGPHLHFEVHRGGYGNPVDPLPYLR